MAKKSTTQTSLTNQKYAIYLIIALLVVICGAVIFLANSVQNADRAYTTGTEAAGIRPPRTLPTRTPIKAKDATCKLGGTRVVDCKNIKVTYQQTGYDGKSQCGTGDAYSASMVCCAGGQGGDAATVTVAAGQLTGGTCATREDLARALAKKCGYTFTEMNDKNEPVFSCR